MPGVATRMMLPAPIAAASGASLWSWGLGTSGQLGDGTTVSKSSPVQVGALTDWLEVRCGLNYGMALKTDGSMWEWGGSGTGQGGNGSPGTGSSPVQVGVLTDWDDIGAGWNTLEAIR